MTESRVLIGSYIHHHVPGVNFASYQARTLVLTQVVNGHDMIVPPGANLLVMRTTIARRHLRALLIVSWYCFVYTTHEQRSLFSVLTLCYKRHPAHEQTIEVLTYSMNKLIMCILFHSHHFLLLKVKTHVPRTEYV